MTAGGGRVGVGDEVDGDAQALAITIIAVSAIQRDDDLMAETA